MLQLWEQYKIHSIVAVCALLICIATAYFFFGVGHKVQGEGSLKKEYGLIFTDYTGKAVSLTEFKRKVLVVYMWASWCPYCGGELEYLAELKSTYGDDIYVVAVNRAESSVDAKAFTDKLKGGNKIIFLLDPNDSLYKSVGGYAMPETLFINSWGDIITHHRGPIRGEEVKEKILEVMK